MSPPDEPVDLLNRQILEAWTALQQASSWPAAEGVPPTWLLTASVLASIVEASEDAITGESLDGTILSWNPGAARLYGYSAAEAVGRSAEMLWPADRRQELAGMHA